MDESLLEWRLIDRVMRGSCGLACGLGMRTQATPNESLHDFAQALHSRF